MKFAPLNLYSGVPRLNRGDTPESGWMHQKVGIQCVLFLVRSLALCQKNALLDTP